MRKSFHIKLLKEIGKNEFTYLTGIIIMFTALFVILFTLFISKKLFIQYSDVNSILLPEKMLFFHEQPSVVYKKLLAKGAVNKDFTLAGVKNYNHLSIYNNINGAKSLPKKFTLLSFKIDNNDKLDLECNGRNYDVKLLDLSLKYQKKWVFRTDKLDGCLKKSKVTLITQQGTINLFLKRNSRYARLVYRPSSLTDRNFYTYLIKLEEKLFLKYFAYSHYYVYERAHLTKETQEHGKMLNSLFHLIFAKSRSRVILNHNAYAFLTEYRKIPFSIKPMNSDYRKSFVVLDELPLDISNTVIPFSPYLIIANYNSLRNIKYDGTVVFLKNSEIDLSSLKEYIVINHNQFKSVLNSSAFKINLVIYTIAIILFILMLMLIKSFISRSYKRYKETFSIFVFFGFSFKIVTLIFTLVILLSLFLAYILILILFQEINHIFNMYYVDLINLNFEYIYILLFVLGSIFSAYFIELKIQNYLINKSKG